MQQRECDNCGKMFVGKEKRMRYCSSACVAESRQPVQKEHTTELERFMGQPEIAQLRAGIKVAIRTAWTRCFVVQSDTL